MPTDGQPRAGDALPEDIEARIYAAFFDLQGDAREEAIADLLRRHAEWAPQIRAAAAQLDSGDRVFAEATPDAPPDVIGPYRIGRKLGEGGFGVVYHAEQYEPFEREVALKLIRPGMDNASVLARFDGERRTLARLDHPSIARVLDAGVTEAGRPWFAMEYVPGVPITRYADDNRLDLTARLRLFAEVCDAVQHAHQRGILHRDLKPSNVLVRVHDERARAKVIDFGIAKALYGPADEDAGQRGRLIGTPAFMSPEQAEGSEDIDIRTDVYALGVLFYSLVSGTMPFDPESMTRRSSEEIVAFLRQNEAPAPSTRVALTDGAASAAERRRFRDPAQLASALRGELDWIARKAIDADRTRRYSTVAAMADDVRRYLAGDTLLAAPRSTRYVLGKFFRKYRHFVAGAAVLLLALIAGLVVSLSLWSRARSAEAQASENARVARASEARALSNARAAKASEKRAQSALADFESLADRLELQQLLEEELRLWPEHPSRVAAMRAWLRRARALREGQDARQAKLDALRARSGREGADGWRFELRSEQFLHDSLATLIRDLKGLSDPEDGRIQDVERRVEEARTIERRTVQDRESEWRAARAGVAADPRFAGFELTPQIGLVPIGPDRASGLQEFAHLRSGRVPLRDGDGSIVKTGDMGIVFVLLPAGRFAMGAQRDDASAPGYEAEARDFETPVREVALDAFFLAKFEVTQAQWRAWTGKNPSRYFATKRFGNLRVGWLHPVENVTWRDVDRVFGQWGLALPTEAQWEYACRASTRSAFYAGARLLDLQGYENLADVASARAGFLGPVRAIPGYSDPHGPHGPVGGYRPNAFGIHDMMGNVSEWCRDRFAFSSVTPRAGDGLRDAEQKGRMLRVFRGGSFASGPRLRTGWRSPLDETGRAGPVGCRAARPVDATPSAK